MIAGFSYVTRKVRRELWRDENLHVACHEAAHAIANTLQYISFSHAEVGKVGDSHGRVVGDGKPYWLTDSRIIALMAGPAFDTLVHPKDSFLRIRMLSADGDYREAVRLVTTGWLVPPWNNGKKYVMVVLLRAKKLVRENWDTILKVGRELAKRKVMTEEEILEVATRPEERP